jgi:hypothetical protein
VVKQQSARKWMLCRKVITPLSLVMVVSCVDWADHLRQCQLVNNNLLILNYRHSCLARQIHSMVDCDLLSSVVMSLSLCSVITASSKLQYMQDETENKSEYGWEYCRQQDPSAE